MRSTKIMLIAFATALALPVSSFAQQTFDSPQAAADALIQAARSNDSAQLRSIFGSQGQQILTSGNPDQDQAERTEFAKLAAEQHKVEVDSRNPNRALLTVGSEDWPFRFRWFGPTGNGASMRRREPWKCASAAWAPTSWTR